MSILFFCPFFNWTLFLSCMSVLFLIFYVLDINSLSDMICKYFLLFSMLPFHFVDALLCCADIFSLISFHLFIFALT